ncbi:MAG: iron ABC transporter permease [Desulfovibrio sp.]|nr:iron ABC transporter permease [Desulfovibrio sp.]
MLLLVALWLCSVGSACFFGSVSLPAAQIIHALLAFGDIDPLVSTIVWELRIPRVFLAAVCGGGLALAGVCLQGVLKNALADPFTLGISQGAACGASLCLVGSSLFGSALFGGMIGIALASFCGALFAMLGTLWLGAHGGRFDAPSVLLAGIAMATFLGALVALVKALHEDSIASIVFWIMGSFQGRSWESLPLLVLTFVPAVLTLCCVWRSLDLFALGDEHAQSIGLNVSWVRFLVLVAASFMTAGCVAVAGVIGFVGLVVPHIVRLLLGVQNGVLLIGAFFGGGILVLWADVVARTLIPDGQEIPVGVVTALLGGPFFAWLVWKKGRGSSGGEGSV